MTFEQSLTQKQSNPEMLKQSGQNWGVDIMIWLKISWFCNELIVIYKLDDIYTFYPCIVGVKFSLRCLKDFFCKGCCYELHVAFTWKNINIKRKNIYAVNRRDEPVRWSYLSPFLFSAVFWVTYSMEVYVLGVIRFILQQQTRMETLAPSSTVTSWASALALFLKGVDLHYR